ncbi:MAG: hypothetical protein ACRDCT_03090, partial [Shewanella sp.]
ERKRDYVRLFHRNCNATIHRQYSGVERILSCRGLCTSIEHLAGIRRLRYWNEYDINIEKGCSQNNVAIQHKGQIEE